ncbi:MAG: hypothetical protein IPI67_24090 [Myxococcales bacterium]|nr:hypothetical protein [Myxococcales bacterium]
MNDDCSAQLHPQRKQRLTRIVAEHSVVYEVWPARIPTSGGGRTIGYDVSLIGLYPVGVRMLQPGCTKCQAIWSDLGELAHASLPRAKWGARFVVRPFDHSLHYYGSTGAAGEVELVIEVRHRTDYSSELDDCEDECLRRLVANLQGLGISRRRGV